ncbi:MAG: patatin-like phospholipase family protein [Thermoanaerobaculia bacterium]
MTVDRMRSTENDSSHDAAHAESAATGTEVAVVLTGGGARAAYQVGFLKCLAQNMPDARLPIITGVSAGAINAAYLAAHQGTMGKAVEGLEDLWAHLDPETIYRVGTVPLLGNVLRWGLRLFSGGARPLPEPESILDVTPLRELLNRTLETVDGEIVGIRQNLESGRLKALALSTLRYSTGQTVTWVQGRDFDAWERPRRIGIRTRIRIEHVMASAALPLMFPAVEIGDSWYGDGGIRLAAPLAPAIHLGADRILAIATRQRKTVEEASEPSFIGYPPPAQVAGTMLNAAFLDAIDQDAENLRRINRVLDHIPQRSYADLRPIRTMVLRPSEDLGRMAADFEVKLPRAFRFFTRGWGTRETRSPDFLSLLMFQSDYLRELIAIGQRDAQARIEEIKQLFAQA